MLLWSSEPDEKSPGCSDAATLSAARFSSSIEHRCLRIGPANATRERNNAANFSSSSRIPAPALTNTSAATRICEKPGVRPTKTTFVAGPGQIPNGA